MTDEATFVDYYNILQIDPRSDTKALEAAYRHWAKMFHPDHPETADVDRFGAVIEAYRVLRDPERRTAYDQRHAAHTLHEAWTRPSDEEDQAEESLALDDAESHARILMALYRRRREDALDAGVSDFVLQEMLRCTPEHFEFHRWYLKAKGFVETTEQGTLAITIAGIDHVISASRTAKVEKLLIGQVRESEG
jgi:curved DNA-binding protein